MSSWQCPDHLKALMSSLKEEKRLCDVIVMAGDEKIRAHRLILIAASKYFKAMFFNNTKESKTRIVQFPGTPKEVVKQCIEFIYTGEVEFSLDNIAEFIKTSDILGLDNLTELYVEFLSENVNQDNILEIISIALLYEREMLKESIEDFFLSGFEKFVESKCYLAMEHNSFACLISHVDDFAGINTKLKVITIMNWINYNCDERKGHFLDLFQMIDMSFLSKEVIQGHVMSEKFVCDSEKCLLAISRSMFGVKESPDQSQSSDSDSDDSEQGTSGYKGTRPKRPKLDNPDDLKMSNTKKSGTTKIPSHIVTCDPTTRVVYRGDLKNDHWSRVTKVPIDSAQNLDILQHRRSIYVGCGNCFLCFDGRKWKDVWKHPSRTGCCYNRCVKVGESIYMVTSSFIVALQLSKPNSVQESVTLHSVSTSNANVDFFVANSAENLYVMGGQYLRSAVIWNIKSKCTQSLSSMIYGRNSGVGVFYQGTVYAIGGGPKTVEFLNPITEHWQIIKGLEICCSGSKTHLSDKLYIFRGDYSQTNMQTIELVKLAVSDEEKQPTRTLVTSTIFCGP